MIVIQMKDSALWRTNSRSRRGLIVKPWAGADYSAFRQCAYESQGAMRAIRWVLLFLVLLAPAVAADWLVTQEGARVETKGPWKVKGRIVVFTSSKGRLSSMRLAEVDLAASAAATEEAVRSAHARAAATEEEAVRSAHARAAAETEIVVGGQIRFREPHQRASGSQPQAQQPSVAATGILTYDVVDRDTYDAPIKTQIEIHAVVTGALTELGLKQLLQKLYDEANATRGFKYHGGKPTHVLIGLYTSRDHFKSGMGQWIAMLRKIGKNSRVEIEVKTHVISQLDAKPEVKHGLPESKRKEIFRASVTAEDRADADALRMYPDQFMKYGEARNTLVKKYEAEVAKRYGITEEQLSDIGLEGVVKNWAMP